jgi:hypothetical protein
MNPLRARASSSKAARGIQRLASDRETIERLKGLCEEAVFFDHAAPSTRKRRESTLVNFQFYMETLYGIKPDDTRALWSSTTIVERSKEYLAGISTWAEGRLDTKVKAGTLLHAKDALYWWCVRYIDDFYTVREKWDRETTAMIYLTAYSEGLSVKTHEKNDLGDGELAMMYKVVKHQVHGLDNWQQNYVAWMLSYVTGARPGSYTVGAGYEKNASLGLRDTTIVRGEDETLRWKDLEWFRCASGVGVRLTFRFLKGQRNPHKRRYIEGKWCLRPSKWHLLTGNWKATKLWTFVPTKGCRYEFDLSLLLFGLAYKRGLFVDEIDEILSAEGCIPTRAEVLGQAVFLAVNQAEELIPDLPMRGRALNPKLQQMCRMIGLTRRNTMYSFRRTAIKETRRDPLGGTAAARELAGHAPASNSLWAYDNEGLGAVDITAFRLREEALSSNEITRMFSQAARSSFQPGHGGEQSLLAAIDARVAQQFEHDPESIKLEDDLRVSFNSLKAFLFKFQTNTAGIGDLCEVGVYSSIGERTASVRKGRSPLLQRPASGARAR